MPETGGRAERIEALIAPLLDDMGFAVVRVAIDEAAAGSDARRWLQVMAERADGVPIGVDECAEISRAVSDALDAETAMVGSFTLEVSSPGIERPLVRIEDYDRFAGREARVRTASLIDGRKRFRGILKGVAGECVRLGLGAQEVALPFSAIADANLVANEAALAASLKRSGA